MVENPSRCCWADLQGSDVWGGRGGPSPQRDPRPGPTTLLGAPLSRAPRGDLGPPSSLPPSRGKGWGGGRWGRWRRAKQEQVGTGDGVFA